MPPAQGQPAQTPAQTTEQGRADLSYPPSCQQFSLGLGTQSRDQALAPCCPQGVMAGGSCTHITWCPQHKPRKGAAPVCSIGLRRPLGAWQAGMAPAPTAESTVYWVTRTLSPHAQGLITTLFSGAICSSPRWPLCNTSAWGPPGPLCPPEHLAVVGPPASSGGRGPDRLGQVLRGNWESVPAE